MNGSSVTAKIAGIESTAKITSVTAISTMTTNSGVYRRRAALDDAERAAAEALRHRQVLAHQAQHRIRFEIGLLVRRRSILMPVKTRNSPNR